MDGGYIYRIKPKDGSDGGWVRFEAAATRLADGKGHTVVELDPETFGWFTGKEDRNGTRVFEGDVLFWKEREREYCVTPTFTKTGVVRFGEYKNPIGAEDEVHLGFYVDWKKGDLPLARKDLLFWLTTDSLKDGAVVIGNVYDNPELLEPDTGSGAEGETP